MDDERSVLTIRVQSADAPGESSRVEISGPGGQFAHGAFVIPFTAEQLSAAVESLDRGDLGSDSAQVFGVQLFDALFADTRVRQDTQSLSAFPEIVIRLHVDDPAVSAVPWELMVDPALGGALALRAPFVRAYPLGQSGVRHDD